MRVRFLMRSGAAVEADVENLRLTRNDTTGEVVSATWDQPPDDAPWSARLLVISPRELVAVVHLPDDQPSPAAAEARLMSTFLGPPPSRSTAEVTP